MIRFGFRARLFWATLVSILCVLGVGYWYLRNATERELLARLHTELELRVGMVGELLVRAGPDVSTELTPGETWSEVAQWLGAVGRTRVTLIRADGVVVGDSDVAADTLSDVENHRERSEVRAALSGQSGVARRLSETVQARMIYVAVPWRRDGQLVGVVRLALPATELDEAVSELTQGLTVSGGVALLIALFVSTVAAHLASTSARTLTQVAQRMRDGDLNARSGQRGTDEFAVLGQALDGLAESLSATLDQLKGERDRLDRVLRSMHEGVLLIDEAGEIVLFNAAVLEMLFLNSGISGRKAMDVVKLDGFREMLEAALRGESSSRELRAKEPSQKILLTNVRRLARRKGALAVFVDITEQRHLETVRQEFVANASHELRTPVAAILSAVETLQGAAADDPEASVAFMSMIERNANRLRSLVDDLLALSLIESGRLEVELKPILLRPAIEGVINGLTPQARAKETELLCRIPTNLTVMASQTGIEHVFSNIIDNAIKYCPPRASVTVAARAANGVVKVTVTDTGPGIDAAHRERIFERFYRVDTGRSRAVGGTGLGLSIVKHWVEAMGGTVRVEAGAEGGTRFCVAFSDTEAAAASEK